MMVNLTDYPTDIKAKYQIIEYKSKPIIKYNPKTLTKYR